MAWMRIRRETGLVEHVCDHGTGHPNWGSALWVAEATLKERDDASSLEDIHKAWLSHGCDGCCNDDDFPGGPRESMTFAHELIREGNETIKELGWIQSEQTKTIAERNDEIKDLREVLHKMRVRADMAAKLLTKDRR